MSKICTKCSRINPLDASFCYFDGEALGDVVRNAGGLNAGARPFHSEFIFPSGQVCRNFDQLARACQENWSAAVELLARGDLAAFLASMGRADLAAAAREAANAPDRERGMDQLLSKLPSQAVSPPKLLVTPLEVNCGRLAIGQDRRLELQLVNQGMRLLYGAVVCSHDWISLGDAGAVQSKVFQFRNNLIISVHIRGRCLRASSKPLEGVLTFESNGGPVEVVLRADVPAKPFREGVLAGATSPRQLAEKAKALPQEASALFAQGAVATWYQENGWTYPVQGHRATGLGAVQQFFEALGLSSPPRVAISEQAVRLQGNVGEEIKHVLTVQAQEKRAVYAHCESDRPWLKIGSIQLDGRMATIPLFVPAVPGRPGETLSAQLTVTANGRQRFVVPVSLRVGADKAGRPKAGPPTQQSPPLPVPTPIQAVAPLHALASLAAPAVLIPIAPERQLPDKHAQPAASDPSRKPRREWQRVLLLAGLLAVTVLGLIIRDSFTTTTATPLPPVPPAGPDVVEVAPIDPDPLIEARFSGAMQFGVVVLKGGGKRLTFSADGTTNNTCLLIDGNERVFGLQRGFWKDRAVKLGNDREGRERKGLQSIFMFPDEKIEVTQTVEVVPGEQAEEIAPGEMRRRLNTCLVRYLIENKDGRPHRAGLRFLLDTWIGANDGVPFTIPGIQSLVTNYEVFNSPEKVPDFIQALEYPDLSRPGTVAHVTLKLAGGLEPPSRVLLVHWQATAHWEVPLRPMDRDSAVVIYWNEKSLQPNEKREMAFAYGLGSVSSAEGGKLGVTLGRGSFQPGEVFQVTAYVKGIVPNQKVKLIVPQGFRVVEGSDEQPVPPVPTGAANHTSLVTWKVRAPEREGNFKLKVQSSTGISQTKPFIVIKPGNVPRISQDGAIFR